MRYYFLILLILFPKISFSFDYKKSDLMEKANDFFNSFTTLEADFIQINNDGSKNIGKIYLERPGKLRWQYNKPSEILIIYNKPDIVYYDKELDELSSAPIKDSLMNLLTKPNINFVRDVQTSNFLSSDDDFSFVAQDKNKKDKSSLVLTFSIENTELIKIEIIDKNEQNATLYLSSIITNQPSPKRVFSTIRPFIFY